MAGAYEEAILGGRRIALARESEFALGRARVRPSMRSVEVDDRSEVIEPRMMQVLVALAGANGQVVTRDELVELCWDGRVVGEDAISRVLWRLRQLLGKLGDAGFEIETIPRVGYRIVVEEEDAPRPPLLRPHPVASGVSRRTMAVGAVAVAGIATVGGLAWASAGRAHAPAPEAKRYFDLAMTLRGQGGYADSQQVVAYLREAVHIDPDYSDAWGALALQYGFQLDWFAPRPDANQLKIAVRSAASRALQLDADNPDAAAALLVLDSPYGRWAGVERSWRDLLARHPHYDCAERYLAGLMVETGRIGAAASMYKRVSDRQPQFWYSRWRVGNSLLALNRLEEAGEQIDAGLRLWPRRLNFWISKIQHLLISGQGAEALRFAHDKSSQPLDYGDVVQRELIIAQAVAEPSTATIARARDALVNYARHFDLAIAAMECPFIGEVDLALEMYEGYFLDRGPWKAGPLERRWTGGLFEATTAQLRKDVRFTGLLNEIGLQRYYQLARVKPDYQLA